MAIVALSIDNNNKNIKLKLGMNFVVNLLIKKIDNKLPNRISEKKILFIDIIIFCY